MAVLIPCGTSETNEIKPLKALESALSPEWAILANLPRSLSGREIDALIVGPRGIIVCELKYYKGALEARRVGAWLRDGSPIINPDTHEEESNFIEQADKAAQSLKSRLIKFDPSLEKLIYVDRCVITTHPDSTLSYSRPDLQEDAATLSGAVKLLERAAQRTHRLIPIGALRRVFDFAEKQIPESLLASWSRAEGEGAAPPPPRPPQPPPSPRPSQPPPPRQPSNPQGSPWASIAVVAMAVGAGVIGVSWLVTQVRGATSATPPQFPLTNFDAPKTVTPNHPSINIRSGPGANFSLIAKTDANTQLLATGTASASDGGLWDYVKLPDGTVGYVNAKLVQEQASPSVPAETTQATASPAPDTSQTTTPSADAAPETNAPQPAAVDEATRARQVITSTNFYRDQAGDSGEVPGQTMILRADVSYNNAKSGDVGQAVLFENNQVVGKCNPSPLIVNGNYWCKIGVTRPGSYRFVVGVNDVPVASHDFYIDAQGWQSQNFSGQQGAPQPGYAPPVAQQLVGAAIEAMRHKRRPN